VLATGAKLAALTATTLLVLLLLSDIILLRSLPHNGSETGACWLTLSGNSVGWLDWGGATATQSHTRCWASAVYGLQALVEDPTPNMGQLWYLLTEMFVEYLPFFR
jgi:hypothetical protein